MVGQIRAVVPVIKAVPGEMLHRTASFIIISDGAAQLLHYRLVVVLGVILFLLVEAIAIYHAEKESIK